MSLGERLKTLRVDKGYSQPALAERVGIEQSYLSKVENDKSIPSEDIFTALLSGLDVSVNDFMSGVRNKKHISKWMQIDAISTWVNNRDATHARKNQRFMLVCYCFIALGITFFYAGFSTKIFPEKAFEYISLGVIGPEEPDDILQRWDRYERAKTREDSLKAALSLQPRLNEKRKVFYSYKGLKFHQAEELERRVYWYEGDYHQPRLVNGLLESLGALFFIAGVIGVSADRGHFVKAE